VSNRGVTLKFGDLEIWVRGRSSLSKMVPFESLSMVSNSHSILTMALHCIVIEINEILVENCDLLYPCI